MITDSALATLQLAGTFAGEREATEDETRRTDEYKILLIIDQ